MGEQASPSKLNNKWEHASKETGNYPRAKQRDCARMMYGCDQKSQNTPGAESDEGSERKQGVA